ncbi:MAG: excinuclease ABC subunit UvrC [Chloroflexi bacterium AL-W]|nr:excinuclease ABC subunit UvrC [Chloroflexi bacterium AL-N1]NOK69354.1 excinuclease ABC subunit UvrC [Chloroflexi bacterium AL-N10]NOK76415.1 excinuclease ABC subunit UvrC [Chloroflexi bacterium AL-N5]NOK83532.1 excinuclease ABC subunit UvrC [Chloroflexi bacterium AL-W]NOK91192.1 excinuclease ABC subunit UvrC [Chloroflexi bacterium AL-N15]
MRDFSHTSIAEPAVFEKRLKNAPQKPGVYIWKNSAGAILYVGKSKKLRDRMRSYFAAPRGLNAKTRRMVAQIADFEIILTTSELEALLLEMNLIKQHRPKYNILLKDDKSYPYIKVTLQDGWPRIFTTRRVLEDGARYFGPYASAGAARRLLKQLNQLFAFRPPFDCKDDKFNRHRRLGKPCMYYDIKRCLGPCVPGLVSQQEYHATIEAVCRFLEGKSEQIVRDLRRKMATASEEMAFERAAYLRDQIRDIEKLTEQQQVLRTVATDQDVIAFAREEGSAVVQIFYIRGGKLIGSEPFALQNTEDEDNQRLLTSFLTQFYDSAAQVPPHILLADYVEEPAIIEQWLRQKGGHKVEIQVPRRGEKKKLVDLASQNASQKLEELRLQWVNSEQRAIAGLTELRSLIDLPDLPTRIECYDISNTQGTNSVGAMVVFEQGIPKKNRYRKFRIKTVDGANDVASIQEILRRRFKRASESIGEELALRANGQSDEQDTLDTYDKSEATSQEEAIQQVAEGKTEQRDDSTWAEIPDLILIDGGVGQLNGAIEVLRELNFDHIPVAGVVKGTKRDRFDLLLPGASQLIVLERTSPALRLVQTIDEETDRFAKQYHRSLRTKSTIKSMLDDIAGIGPKRKRALLKAFGSLDGIREASVDELAAIPGMTHKSAEELKSLL